MERHWCPSTEPWPSALGLIANFYFRCLAKNSVVRSQASFAH